MKGSKIVVASLFVASFVLTAAVLYVQHLQTSRISDNVVKLSRAVKIADGSERFQHNFRRMATGLRNYLSTGEPTSREVYEQALSDNNVVLHELSALVPETSEQKILIDDIRELQQYWIDEVASPMLHAREIAHSKNDVRKFRELYDRDQVEKLEVDVGLSLQRKFSDLVHAAREAYFAGPMSNKLSH